MFVSVFYRFYMICGGARLRYFTLFLKKSQFRKNCIFIYFGEFLANSVILYSQWRKIRFLFGFFKKFRFLIWKIAHFLSMCEVLSIFSRKKYGFLGYPLMTFLNNKFSKKRRRRFFENFRRSIVFAFVNVCIFFVLEHSCSWLKKIVPKCHGTYTEPKRKINFASHIHIRMAQGSASGVNSVTGGIQFSGGFSELPCGFICCFFISRNQIDHSESIGDVVVGSNEFWNALSRCRI